MKMYKPQLLQRADNRYYLYFSDGMPVGFRNQMGVPFPESFTPHGWETQEEADKALADMESYLTKNQPSNWTSKRKKK